MPLTNESLPTKKVVYYFPSLEPLAKERKVRLLFNNMKLAGERKEDLCSKPTTSTHNQYG